MLTRLDKHRATLAAVSVTTVGALLWLLLKPHTADMAAQVFRSESFADNGPQIWNGQWYGGHYLPSYSVLSPALGAFMGAWLAGAVAAVLAAWALATLARAATTDQRASLIAALLFASGCLAALFSGRTTYLLGLAFGAAALAALLNDRSWKSWGPLAFLTSLASPVAAAFLGLCAIARLNRKGIAVALVAGTPLIVFSVLFPDGGTQPFTWEAFVPVVIACVLTLALTSSDQKCIRVGALLYLLATVFVFIVPTPIGSNITRLGQLAAGPVAAIVLIPAARTKIFLFLLPFALLWQWTAPVVDVQRAIKDDHSRTRAFYAPLISQIRARGEDAGRVEIIWTRGHWEDAYVAKTIPLARGWERQLDRKFNSTVNGPLIAPAAYRKWIDALSVRWVALPTAQLDSAVEGEAALVSRGLPWLKPVWQSKDWKLFAVANPTPIAAGISDSVTVETRVLGPETVSLVIPPQQASHPGPVHIGVSVRWSPWWWIEGSQGCLRELDNTGFTELVVDGNVLNTGAKLKLSVGRSPKPRVKCDAPAGN